LACPFSRFNAIRLLSGTSTTREDMKDRIRQVCSEITIVLIKVCQTFQRL